MSELTQDKNVQMINKRDCNEIISFINDASKSDLQINELSRSKKNFNFSSSNGVNPYQSHRKRNQFGVRSTESLKPKDSHENNPELKSVPFINKRLVENLENALKTGKNDNSFNNKSENSKDPRLMYKVKYNIGKDTYNLDNVGINNEVKKFEKNITKDYLKSKNKQEQANKDYAVIDQNLVSYNVK